MDRNNNLSDSFKKISVSSMLTYFRALSVENQESILRWAKTSKNPNANINTTSPNEWEKNMKTIFSQLTHQEQAEVILQATKILEERKKGLGAKSNIRR